ncbi:PAS domain S-box-containing protein/diguanylate cyclase (GGDEF)-like protein [Rivibacter subsaxonicus]|uniref:diguanylate cyclase n=2 Tax=Rivibacter subsaxonicus TaxID=457575 RepID=A0A4Q7VMU0_9BURK|nr:PAS domain S-box-containing protein/diguanylate cyclase (GGDEF)-like protein [Rivibacter subsaxonicus]
MLPATEAMTAPALDPSWMSLAVALDAIGAAVYLKDGNSRYVFANEATERLLGIAHGSLAGRADAELLPPALTATLRLQDQALGVQPGPVRSEFTIDRDGQRREFQTVRMRLDPAGPGGAALLGVWLESSPLRRAEASLREALLQLEAQQQVNAGLREDAESRGTSRAAGGGLYPAEQFEDHLRREVDLSMREHREFAVVLVELDPASAQGPAHDEADRERVAESLAGLLRGNTRAMDAPCRMGRDSFAVLLSGVGLATAHSRMESLRRQCATQLVVRDGQALRFTVSMGVASFPHTAQTQSGLVQAASDALAEAKQRGGNHVALASIPFDPR